MPLLAIVLSVAVALWSGWWWIAATAMDRGAGAAFAALEDQGWHAGTSDVTVRGYPNRLDLTVSSPYLRDPVTGLEWQAPFVQLLTLSYRPWHVILALPPEQRVQTPAGRADLASEKLQASVVLRPETALPLDRITVAGDGLRLGYALTGGDMDMTVTVDKLRIGTRASASRRLGHDLAAELTGIMPDPRLIAALPAGTTLPGRIDRLRLDVEADFTAPLDRHAGETRPAPETITLKDLTLDWGGLRITGSGSIMADAAGMPEGRMTFRIENWPLALGVMQAAGFVTPEVSPTWARMFGVLEEAGGVPGRIELPLNFAKGRMSLGPLPLGLAPQMRPALRASG